MVCPSSSSLVPPPMLIVFVCPSSAYDRDLEIEKRKYRDVAEASREKEREYGKLKVRSALPHRVASRFKPDLFDTFVPFTQNQYDKVGLSPASQTSSACADHFARLASTAAQTQGLAHPGRISRNHGRSLSTSTSHWRRRIDEYEWRRSLGRKRWSWAGRSHGCDEGESSFASPPFLVDSLTFHLLSSPFLGDPNSGQQHQPKPATSFFLNAPRSLGSLSFSSTTSRPPTPESTTTHLLVRPSSLPTDQEPEPTSASATTPREWWELVWGLLGGRRIGFGRVGRVR
ncbi:hypothetical protein BDY24DRAFT_114867 [Mrakia frigida]|uniref:uncharacterized protein n=1 Tax=Mrakia frigida TaxID=29902 RepID=UPI003FCC1893